MKTVMYRQPRQAAVIYAATEEELQEALLLRKRKRLQRYLTLVLALLSLLVTITLVWLMRKDMADREFLGTDTFGEFHDPLCPDAVRLQEQLAEKVLRLHILADSDETEDQEVKLLVRDAVLSYLSSSMSDCTDKASAKEFLIAHLSEIAEIADSTLREAGFDYRATARITTSDFPWKIYEDIFLPAGTYETLQITLGSAQGQNWWCIIFPSLCLTHCLEVDNSPVQTAPCATPEPESTPSAAISPSVTPAAVPPSHISLRNVLEQREYEAIRVDRQRVTFRFRFLDLLRFVD